MKNTEKRQTELCKRALSEFGRTAQMLKVFEELLELHLALTTVMLALVPDKNSDAVLEEVADVEIMLEQLKLMFCVEEESFDMIKNRKLDKLESYLL